MAFSKKKEYFLSYEEFPYFKNQTLNSIQNVQLLHGYHCMEDYPRTLA